MAKTIEPPTPQNVEAEQAVLGAILLDGDSFFNADLKPHEFYLDRHRWIWEAAGELASAQTPIDFLTLNSQLDKNKRLAELGGAAYMTSLLNAVPTAAHIVHYAGLVRHAFVRRELIQKSTEIAAAAYGGATIFTDELLTKAHSVLNAIEAPTTERGAAMSDVALELMGDVEEWQRNPRETFGVPTHLTDLDKITNGLNGGDFIIVVGDPGQGKTALVHQKLLNIGLDGVRARLYSFEMPKKRVALRMACNLAGVNSRDLKRGQVTGDNLDAFYSAMGRVSQLPLRIVDIPCSMEQVALDLAKDERAGVLPQVVAIDYSKLMTDKNDNEVIRMGNITRGGKQIAMRFGVCLIMVHVLNGDSAREGRMPELRDLGWARQSQYDPDIVLATRLQEGKPAAVGVLKNREGEWGNGLGEFMSFTPAYTRWGNLAKDTPEPPAYMVRREIVSPIVPSWDDVPMVEAR